MLYTPPLVFAAQVSKLRAALAAMAATHTIVSADTLTGEPFVLRMPSHEAGLELAAARLLAAEFRVSTAEVDELLRPPQAAKMQSAEERAALHDKLVARGLQANREGGVAKAADLFWDAWRLDQRKPSTLISMLNMRAAAAAALSQSLSPRLRLSSASASAYA